MDKDVSLYQQVNTLFHPLGKVEALLLTSFGLDVSYFEKSILPAFFPHLGEGPATEPHRPLFEYLEETAIPISVLFDANNLVRGETVLGSTGSVTKELRWQAHPVIAKSGCFHPKVIIAQVRDQDRLSLVVGCSSANLTRPGWGHNFEACVMEVITLSKGMRHSLLLDLQALLKKFEKYADNSDAIGILLKTIEEIAPKKGSHRKHDTRYYTRLWFGQDGLSLSQWLKQKVLRDDLAMLSSEWKLEVLSPYFSETPPETLNWVSKEFSKHKEENEHPRILCFCPKDGDVFDVDRKIIQTYSELKHFTWAEFPTDRLRSQIKDQDGKGLHRFLHAKVYRFWTPKNELLVVGSANATTQGNRDRPPANDEACLIFSRELEEGAKPFSAWLRPLNQSIKELECREETKIPEDIPSEAPVPRLSIQFDWLSHKLTLNNQDYRDLDVYLGGSLKPLVTVSAVKNNVPLQPIVLSANNVESLFRSPTLKVSLLNSPEIAWLCLIEEINLHAKPPAPTMERSVDDLIRDWQMGADERQADHVARAAMPDDLRASGGTSEMNSIIDQDRLNDIFLAMWRFKTDLLKQLDNDDGVDDFTRLQLQSRLFGGGAMSVRYLVNKMFMNTGEMMLDSTKLDPVELYIGLLSVFDAVKTIEFSVIRQGFEDDLRALLQELNDRLSGARENIKELLSSESNALDPDAFIEWIESNYLQKETIGVSS
ncbi:MAG TPA: hypothetical protein PK501_01255 [Thiotrichales bacterium]|nr:hypothetical protein [Thiotrichales bacterium]